MAEKIEILLTAQDRASASVKGLETNLKRLGTAKSGPLGMANAGLGKFGLSLSTLAGPFVAGAAIGALGNLASAVTDFAGQSVQAAIDEEQNIAKLTAALEANVAGFNGYMGSVESAIKSNEALAFTDDDLRDSLAQLAFVTHDTKNAFEGQAVAMDLARAKNMSLHDASVLVGKVLAGNYTGLKRLGIAIGDVKDPMTALARLQTIFAGQAKQYAETTKGQLEALGIELQDVEEEMGAHLLPATNKLASGMKTNLVPALEDTADALGTLLDFASANIDEGEAMQWIMLLPDFVRSHLPPQLTTALTESLDTSSRAAFIQSERSENNQAYAQRFGVSIADSIQGGIQDGMSAWDLDKDLAGALAGTSDIVTRAIQKAQMAAANPNAQADSAALIQRGLSKIDALEAANPNAAQMTIYEQSRRALEDQLTYIGGGQTSGQGGWQTAASSSGSFPPHSHDIYINGSKVMDAIDPVIGKRLALASRAPYTRN